MWIRGLKVRVVFKKFCAVIRFFALAKFFIFFALAVHIFPQNIKETRLNSIKSEISEKCETKFASTVIRSIHAFQKRGCASVSVDKAGTSYYKPRNIIRNDDYYVLSARASLHCVRSVHMLTGTKNTKLYFIFGAKAAKAASAEQWPPWKLKHSFR